MILKTKDETHMLRSWIDHHAAIVGRENLIILDNGSTDPSVVELLHETASDAVVATFDGFHNAVHRPEVFGDLYDAVRQSAEYFCLIDTDERLAWADSAERLAANREVLLRLKSLPVEYPFVVPGVWLDNVDGSHSLFRMFGSDAEWPTGLSGGKTIFSSQKHLPKLIGHNFQAEVDRPQDVNCGNLLVLHLKNLDAGQRIKANLRKLMQYNVLDKSISFDLALERALQLDADTFPNGNPKKWLSEIHALSSRSTREEAPRTRRRGVVELSDNGKLTFAYRADGDRFARYLESPGLYLQMALKSRDLAHQANEPARAAALRKHEDLAMKSEDLAAPGQGIAVPTAPSMDSAGSAYFRSMLKGCSCYLEYGSGGSTRLAARLNVPNIYSVESDPDFGRVVRRHVSSEHKSGRFKMVVPEVGSIGAYGYPRDTEHCVSWWRYPLQVWDVIEAEQQSPDLVLVDGRFRVACLLVSLLRCRPGARVLFDDFANRLDRYGSVRAVLEPYCLHGRMAEFVVPESLNVREAARQLLVFANDRR